VAPDFLLDLGTVERRRDTVMPTTPRAARIGLWLLPAYGILLGLGTLTHQPPIQDFDAYARYITTDVFLVSHLGASIFGAALAVLGVVAVTAYLVPGRAAGLAVVGLVLTTVANIFLSAAFGSAAFVQPGIGRAYLAGVQGMPALNADTAYGPALAATAAGATLLFVAAAVVLGIAIARTDRGLRAGGVAYAVLLPLFALSGFVLSIAQSAAGFAVAVATAVLAVQLPRTIESVPSEEKVRSLTNQSRKPSD
jgi:hypothetical protein